MVLSNHFHLLLSAQSSPDLALFMCYFKGNLARELARVHEWHGTLWQKRYSTDDILDETGLIEAFKYITENSVKEGLVDHPKDWTGLHGYRQLVMGKKVSGPGLIEPLIIIRYSAERANSLVSSRPNIILD